MSKRIVPVVTATVCLIIRLIENWNNEIAMGLLNNIVENGDFRNTNVNHWKPILSRCEEYLKEKFEGNIENFGQAKKMVTLEEDTKERVLVILRFLTKVVEKVKDASTYPFKLGWPLMNLTYCFDLEVAIQASFLLSEICSDRMKIELLFEGSPLNYDEFIGPLVEINNPSMRSFDWRLQEVRRVYDFYGCIQGLRVGGCSGTNIDERLIQIKYDMKRIIMNYQDELSGIPFCEEINESSKLKEHLNLLKKETVSLQLKSGVLRYIKSLFKCIFSSDVNFVNNPKCFLDNFVLPLWGIVASNIVQISLVRGIMNLLECFALNAPHNLNSFRLIMNLLDFIVKNFKKTPFCEEQGKLEVLKCFIKILEQRNFKEEEITVIAKRIKEIVSQLSQRKESWMEYFGVHLEIVECFLRKPNHVESISTDTLIDYKNVLIFVVYNRKKFTVDAQVSVIKGLGTLSSIKILENLEDFSRAERCPKCGKNYMGLLAVLVRNIIPSPCFVGEAVRSVVRILRNECHGVGIQDLGLPSSELERLCRAFIKNGMCFLEYHFMPYLVNLLGVVPNVDGCIFYLTKEVLMECIDGENDKSVVLSGPKSKALTYFDDMLFPECNFDEGVCMPLSVFNHYLSRKTHKPLSFVLHSDELVDIISYPKLSYKFHRDRSEFTCFLKNICQYLSQDLEYYEWFIGNYFLKFQELLKKIEGRSKLDDRSRISIVITLIRMVDVLFIDGCDPRKRIRGNMGLERDFWWETLRAIVKIRDFILSLYNKDLTFPKKTRTKYTQKHLLELIPSPNFVDNSFWSFRGIDNGVGHINRTVDLLFRLQVFIFDRIMLQGSFLEVGWEKLGHNTILSIVDEVRKDLKLGEEGCATRVEGISEMGSVLGRILNTTGNKFLGELFFGIGTGSEMCKISVKKNGGKMARITLSELRDPTFYTENLVEIKTPHLSKILRFYYSLFGEVKDRGVDNKDIGRDLMIFLKSLSKSDMNINDTRIFAKLVDMTYCMINGVSFVEYSKFTDMIDHFLLFGTGIAITDGISNLNNQNIIEDECLRNAVNQLRCSGVINENIIQDFTQKMSVGGFCYVRYRIDGFINQLGFLGDVGVDIFLIELISNNFLIYSFLNPCVCGKDDGERCISHYDKRRIVEFIDCLDKYLSSNTLNITLKSYSSLLKLSEVDESLVSKMEIFKRFPLKKLLSLISSSKEFLSMFKLFKVVIEQFLESKECVRRLINNELLVNKDRLDINNVEAAVDMRKSLAFRNMEIFVECIRNEKRCVIARRDQSGDKLCRRVVKKVIECIDEDDGCRVLSLQLLTEIIFNHPCLSVLCGDKGFIENTILKFIGIDGEEKCVWGRCFINVIFTRTSNFKLKRMILNAIILKMKTGNGSFLKNGFSLLLDLFNCKVRVEKYSFSEDFACDRKGIDEHDCNGYCEVKSIFKQNSDVLSDRRLLDTVLNGHGDYMPMRSSDVTKLSLLMKMLLLLHLRNVPRSKEDGASEETVLSYLSGLEGAGEVLSSGLYCFEFLQNHEGDVGMPDSSSDENMWKEFRGFEPVHSAGLESSLSKWRIGEEMMGGSIDLAYFIQSYMERHESRANEAKDEANASTISLRGRNIFISEDRPSRRSISCGVDQDIPASTMDCYFNEWIDKEKNEVMKVLWGNGPDYFQGALPPMPPKAYANIAWLLCFSDGETLTGLCGVLSCLPFDRRIQRAFFKMVVCPLYKLGTCSQENIETLCNDLLIKKVFKMISGVIRLSSNYRAYFLVDTKLVYSLFLCYNKVQISRDLIEEMSTYEVKIDEVCVDFEDGIDLSWMDDISRDSATQSINHFDSMISKDCPVVRLLRNHEKLWLGAIASFINESEFENSVLYVLRVILLSKVVPITVCAFIFFDIFVSKLERLTMSHECGYNEYSALRNVFRGLALLLSLDKGGLSANLKDYYNGGLVEEDPVEMLKITLYFQERLGKVLSVEVWKMIFLIMGMRNVVLGSADFLCIFEVFCGVSALKFGERISELAEWYCDIYGLCRNQIKKRNNGIIFFNLDEPSGIRRGFEGYGNRSFENYSTFLIIDCSAWLWELKYTEFSKFLYNRGVGPTFMLRRKRFYETIKEFQWWGSYTLEVDRGNLLYSSYEKMMNINEASEFGDFNLRIRFKDELGIDAGGLLKEWFLILGEEMMKFKGILFDKADNPGMREDDKGAHGSGDSLEHFGRFVGRVMGLAVLYKRCMGLSFPLAVYRFLLFDECNVRDMMDFDPQFFGSIFNLRKGGDLNSSDLTFTFIKKVDEKTIIEVPMKENGGKIEVTEDNLEEYIEESARFRVIYGKEKQMEELRIGFWEVVDIPELKKFFTAEELKVLVEGSKTIDLDDWKEHSVFEDLGNE
jgi:hypothetical protein